MTQATVSPTQIRPDSALDLGAQNISTTGVGTFGNLSLSGNLYPITDGTAAFGFSSAAAPSTKWATFDTTNFHAYFKRLRAGSTALVNEKRVFEIRETYTTEASAATYYGIFMRPTLNLDRDSTSNVNGINFQTTVNLNGYTNNANEIAFSAVSQVVGAGNVASVRGVTISAQATGGAVVTNDMRGIEITGPTLSGGATTPIAYGLYVYNQKPTGVTTAYSIYSAGTSDIAYFAGSMGINESSPDYKLDVNGSLGFTPGASVTPVDNGDVVIEATNNTTLTLKLKGSDGTVRSVALTLA